MILQMSKQNFNTYKQLLINTSIQFIMKKIFFVAIAATLLAAGCQKTEVLNQVVPVGEPSMTFAPNMGKLTKAAESAGMDNLKAQDFRLWAYYVEADPNRGAAANSIYDGMGNITVSDGTDGKWGTTVAHFWTGKDKALRFFAVSADPDTYGTEGKVKNIDADADTKVTIDPATQEVKISGFFVDPTKPDVDLMIADYEEADQDKYKDDATATKTAKLKFRHALAKVEFNFVNEMAEEDTENKVIVQHMYVDNIKTTGTVTVRNQAATLLSDAWETTDAHGTFKGDYDGKDTDAPSVEEIEEAENIEQFVGEGKGKADVPTGHEMLLTVKPQTYTTWLVIPQTVGTAQDTDSSLNLVIAYLIGKRQFVAKFPLFRSTVDAWNPNQYIKYNVSLSPNIIGFTPSVEDWDEKGTDNKDKYGVAINQ